MPAVPKIADISGEKRPIKVFRSMNAEEIAKSDGKSAVSGKIKKQIKAVSVHVTDERSEMPTARRTIEPVLLD